MVDTVKLGDSLLTPRWGALGTSVWTLVLAAIFVIVQTITILAVVQSDSPNTSLSKMDLTQVESDGRVLALATIATTAVILPMLLIAVKLKRGSKLSDYLALSPVTFKTTMFWVAAALLLGIVGDVVKWVFGLSVANDFVLETYNSMGNVAVFLISIAILAPLTEELFCRGFMISGFQRSVIGSSGAVVITAILWASIHLQYELHDIAFIFLLGCLLGASRVITGSVYPAIAAHVSINFLSYVVTGIYIGSFSN